MKLSKISIENFKSFQNRDFLFHDQFNLIVGGNGSGKTSILDACAVAIGSFLLGVDGVDTRHIHPHEVRLKKNTSTGKLVRTHWEKSYPCAISAIGDVYGENIAWRRAINSDGGKTTYAEANSIKSISKELVKKARNGEDVDLPVISYYGTGRLWQEPRENFKVKRGKSGKTSEKKSRLGAYITSVDPRLSVKNLTDWIADEAWIAFQNGIQTTEQLEILSTAVLKCLDGATNLKFDADQAEVVLTINGIEQPFSNLSDGQRCMAALIGDIAKKAITLNPHLGVNALSMSKGIVLIDELDLHLHPKWQVNLVENIRSTFPSIQFICTTHSPFLIQSLRDGEELLVMDGQPLDKVNNLSIEEISLAIQNVEDVATSALYRQMKDEAKLVLIPLYSDKEKSLTEKEKLSEDIDRVIKKYADNPAYQAFLEIHKLSMLGD